MLLEFFQSRLVYDIILLRNLIYVFVFDLEKVEKNEYDENNSQTILYL